MTRNQQIIIWIAIAVILMLIYIYVIKPNMVIADNGDVRVTNKVYKEGVDAAVAIFNELKDSESQDRIADYTPSPKLIDKLSIEYPELSGYVAKYKSLTGIQKAFLVAKGISLALNKNTKESIAQKAVTNNKPVWLIILENTFSGF